MKKTILYITIFWCILTAFLSNSVLAGFSGGEANSGVVLGTTKNGWSTIGNYFYCAKDNITYRNKWINREGTNGSDNFKSTTYCYYVDSTGRLVTDKNEYTVGTKVFSIDLNGKATFLRLTTESSRTLEGWVQVYNSSVQKVVWSYYENNKIQKSRWIQDKYYVDKDGIMLTNTWTPDGYYVDSDGAYVASMGKKSNTSTTNNNSNNTSNNKSNTNSSTNTNNNQRTIIASNIENPYNSSNVNYLTEEQEQAIINGANSITEIINGNSNSNINNNSNIINTTNTTNSTNNTVLNNTTNSNENLKNNTISSSNNSNSYLSELDDLLDNNKVDTSIIYKAKSTISNGSSFYLSTVENGSLDGWEKYVINTKVTSGNNQGVWFKYNTTWYFIICAENKAEDSNGKKLTINNNTAYVIEDILKDGIYVISSDSKYMAYKFDEEGKCLTPNGLTNSSGTAILFKTNGEIKSGYAKEVSEDESTLKIYDTTTSKSVKIDGVSRTVTFIDDTYEKNGSNYSGTYLNDGYWIKSSSSKYTLMKSDSNGKTSSVSAAGSTLGEIESYITKKNYTNQASEVVLSNSKTTTANTSSSSYKTITTYTYSTKDLLTISSSAINSGSLELNINNKTLLGQGTYYNTIDNKTYTVNSSGNISNVTNGKTSGATSGSYSKLVIDSTNYLIK